MNQQSPTFAADIRPLFRDSDIEEMSWSFDLASFDEVRDNAEAIYERLKAGGDATDLSNYQAKVEASEIETDTYRSRNMRQPFANHNAGLTAFPAEAAGNGETRECGGRVEGAARHGGALLPDR